MTDFSSLQFRRPQNILLDNDYRKLSTIKINPNLTATDCQRIVDILDGNTPSAESGPSEAAPKNILEPSVKRKELNFDPIPRTKNTLDDCDEEAQTNKRQKVDGKRAFQVIYGKHKPYKKNKEWSFDGFVLIEKNFIMLYGCSGKVKGRVERANSGVPKVFKDDVRIVIGSWECELCGELNVSEFESGAYFIEDSQE